MKTVLREVRAAPALRELTRIYNKINTEFLTTDGHGCTRMDMDFGNLRQSFQPRNTRSTRTKSNSEVFTFESAQQSLFELPPTLMFFMVD